MTPSAWRPLRLGSIVVVLALVCVAGVAVRRSFSQDAPGARLAEKFKQLDADGDGQLTPEEFPQAALFRQIDANADGLVTRLEAMRYFAARLPGGSTPGPTPPAPKTDAPKPAAPAEPLPAAGPPLAPVREGPRPLKPAEHGVGRYVPDIEFTDLAGQPRRLSEWREAPALVVAMTSTTCPLSKKYLPTLAELAARYRERGVPFVVVNTVATDRTEAMQAAAAALGDAVVYVPDAELRVARAVGATSTTDVVVLDRARTVVYHGAVDDQYGFGYAVDRPRTDYLADALEAVLAGKSPRVAATESPGCLLDDAAPPTADAPATPITYHNRVSRIMARNCVECHRPGGVGPFELVSAEDVLAHAPMIREVIERGIMPPWFAAPGTPHEPSPWANDRSLAAAEKADLLAWLDGGRPLGDPADGISPPQFAEGWLIGKPDAIYEFAEPVAVKATGTMPYQTVFVDTHLEQDRWVEAIEIQPGDRGVVHHVLVFVVEPGDAEGPRRDEADERSGFWGIYVPGNSTLVYPEGFAKRLPKGARLRFQMHYTPNGTATTDRTRIGLRFATTPPRHEVRVAGVVNPRISIPPGADHHQEVATLRLPFDVQVLGFLPHMHLRGKACRYEVLTAEGAAQLLLDVPRYDFNWQLLYRYFDPLPLPAGATLRFTAWYDNSAGNPANPDPTQTVRWGSQTFDEMHLGYVEYIVPGAVPGETPSLPRGGGLLRGRGGAEGGAGGFDVEAAFRQLDADQDGRLTAEELPAASRERLLRLDTSGDGALSLDEARRLEALLGRGP